MITVLAVIKNNIAYASNVNFINCLPSLSTRVRQSQQFKQFSMNSHPSPAPRPVIPVTPTNSKPLRPRLTAPPAPAVFTRHVVSLTFSVRPCGHRESPAAPSYVVSCQLDLRRCHRNPALASQNQAQFCSYSPVSVRDSMITTHNDGCDSLRTLDGLELIT